MMMPARLSCPARNPLSAHVHDDAVRSPPRVALPARRPRRCNQCVARLPTPPSGRTRCGASVSHTPVWGQACAGNGTAPQCRKEKHADRAEWLDGRSGSSPGTRGPPPPRGCQRDISSAQGVCYCACAPARARLSPSLWVLAPPDAFCQRWCEQHPRHAGVQAATPAAAASLQRHAWCQPTTQRLRDSGDTYLFWSAH